jgi:hypothetical protein
MTGHVTSSVKGNNSKRPFVARGSAIAIAAIVGTTFACASGPDPETSGIPGFEPTFQTVTFGANDRFSVLDSNDVVVASRDRSLLGGIYILLDDAQLPFRRYFQSLPPRTFVGLLVQAGDSIAMDSVVQASRARVVEYETVVIPRDNSGNPLPIARFLVSSVRNKVAREWVLSVDSAAGTRPLPDWIVAGVTQLITGFPSSSQRNSQLQSQRDDLIPIDSLMAMSIPEDAVPAGVSGDGAMGGRLDRNGRPVQPATPRKFPTQTLAALQSASIIEFMWAREGRGIIKQLVTRARRGEPLSAVIGQAVSLPHDAAGLDSVWKASLTPPPKPKK